LSILLFTVVQITLVDQSDRFTFKPLLYELLNGTAQAGEVAPTFTQLLAPYPIQFVQVCLAHFIALAEAAL
jgi:NADH dehydrogenase FAD-containing subunit